ncbi:hypothetical protein [Brucella intermedia]|uniref:hypothetical protein n=1 Tax=Brucella intermedia TaxID=94625 RepID=UPI000EFB1016|nr:hypothetical protein [Brucella intermedia]KAB2720392.1 hypothetical protein F9K75_04790 [Brucella intermedia]
MPENIEPLYRNLIKKSKKAGESDLKSDITSNKIAEVVVAARSYLSTLNRTPLVSIIPNKKYFMFTDSQRSKSSRSVNESLYLGDLDRSAIDKVLSCEFDNFSSDDITKIVYTCAISYCCATDILKKSDQKTPGTFFEVLIGHLVARALGVNPEKQISVPTLDLSITLPTDYVFDLGPGKNRLHLPCKISTRERVVQVWAHQRVLDGMHGVARFKGVLVSMAETNKQEDKSVVEVCLPNQWTAYQMYIAQMFRVYYLDIPQPYVALKDRYPFIQVKQFGEFFRELDKIRTNGAN